MITLAIDIGGTGLKAMVLGGDGSIVHERVRIETTYPCPPAKLVDDLVALVTPLGEFDRISVGFPGVVHAGAIHTAPTFVTRHGLGSKVDSELVAVWRDFPLADTLSARLDRPCRVANDADVQGAGASDRKGYELILTLGTGIGSALFRDGNLVAHLELAHHPIKGDATYNDYLGNATRKHIGRKRWNRRIAKMLQIVDEVFNPDTILLGGGNAARVDLTKVSRVEADIRLIDNTSGLLGGLRLWEPGVFE